MNKKTSVSQEPIVLIKTDPAISRLLMLRSGAIVVQLIQLKQSQCLTNDVVVN